MPTALNITISETLVLLDDSFREFADGIADDSYAIWCGAGISLRKLPGLEAVAEAVLEHLRILIEPANTGCHWRDSLDRILALIGLTSAEWAKIDYTQSVVTWPDIAAICRRLVTQYARMLDQSPIGRDADYLLWEAVNVVGRYADPMITPGAEHLALAALIIEGVASDTASANWDGLIEKAMVQLIGGAAATKTLQPRVLPGDVQSNITRARLYKFHGCAVLAGLNAPRYRARLVGRISQISGWAYKPENMVIASKLRDMAISKRTLMLGLSAQDANIQAIFVDAQTQLPTTFPTHPPAVVLSEERVGPDQRSLLQNFYKDDYAVHAPAIEKSALLRAYAHALLPALWLYVVCAKLSAFIGIGILNFSNPEKESLRTGLKALRDAGAATSRPNGHEAFVLQALAVVGRAMHLFRNGQIPLGAGGIYTPVTISPLTLSLNDPTLESSGLPQLAIAIALIGLGHAKGHWVCGLSDPTHPKAGVLSLKGLTRTSEVFFASNAQAATRLILTGHVSQNDDAIIIHSHEVTSSAVRTPSAAPGRTLRVGLREFSVTSLAVSAANLDVLEQQFKAGMKI